MMFGYSTDRAEAIKESLERDLAKLRFNAERIGNKVPDTSVARDRMELLAEEAQEVVSDLCAIVDQRTDNEPVASR